MMEQYWFDNSPDNKVDKNNTQRSFGDYVNYIEEKNKLKQLDTDKDQGQDLTPSLDNEKSQLRYSQNSRIKSEEGKSRARKH